MNYPHPVFTAIRRFIRLNWIKFTLISLAAVWMTVLAFPGQKNLQIVFCSVGQGDSILIQKGFYQLLIDGGSSSQVLNCLQRHLPFFDRKIEVLVATHAEADHAGGLVHVIEKYDVMSFVYNGLAGKGEFWNQISRQIITKGIPVAVLVSGDKINFIGAELEILWPALKGYSLRQGVSLKNLKNSDPSVLGVQSSRDLNSDSLVLLLKYDGFDALLTGDISEKEELVIASQLNKRGNLGIDVLKVAHHGSKYSSATAFLEVLRPALSIIEVGKNSYGHPTKETLDRLTQIGSKILRTDRDGDVTVTTDGRKWSYKTSRL